MKSATSTRTQNLVLMGILVAIEVILGRFLSIRTPIVTIGFGFVPIVIAAMLLTPGKTAVVAGLADILGALLFPVGPYFIGFTITSVLMGLTWGLFLKQKPLKLPNIIVASLIVNLGFSAILNSFWIYILVGTPISALVPLRIPKALIMIVVHTLVISGIKKAIESQKLKFSF